MKYAIIQLAGKQLKVVEGEKITVTRLEAKEGDELKISDVLLSVDGEKIAVGAPLIDKALVTLKVVSHDKGDKIRVAKYRAKSRYRRVKGFRASETTLEVVKIG